MSRYNFEEDRNFQNTRRVKNINDEIIKRNNSYKDELGDKDDYLRIFNSEDFNQHNYNSNQYNNSNQYSQYNNTNINSRGEYYDDDYEIKRNSSYRQQPPQKGNGVNKILILIIVGLIVFIGVFIFTFFMSDDGSNKNISNNNNNNSQFNNNDEIDNINLKDNTQKDNDDEEDKEEEDGETYLISDISSGNILKLVNIKTGGTSEVTITNDTKFSKTSASSISKGDIVSIVKSDDKKNAKNIKLSEELWKTNNVSGVEIDTSSNKININGSKFNYNKNTVFSYKDRNINPSDILKIDQVSVSGMNTDVWYVSVVKYHGFISVNNKSKVESGTIQIDKNQALNLDNINRIPVSEGAHSVIVQGSNIETYTADIFVVASEQFDIDLTEAQTKTSVLVVKANVEDYKLFINDNLINDPLSPQVLPIGDYKIRVEKDGYKSWEDSISLTDSSKEITAQLEENIKYGSYKIMTKPAGADIYIDGEYVGISPVDYTMSYGDHKLLIKLEGYYDMEDIINLNAELKQYSTQLISSQPQ